jgi:hypothetical protein
MSDERRFTIRRVDRDDMGDYGGFDTDSLDGWEMAEFDSEDAFDPVEYITEEWVRVGYKTRTFIEGRDAADVLAERAAEEAEE